LAQHTHLGQPSIGSCHLLCLTRLLPHFNPGSFSPCRFASLQTQTKGWLVHSISSFLFPKGYFVFLPFFTTNTPFLVLMMAPALLGTNPFQDAGASSEVFPSRSWTGATAKMPPQTNIQGQFGSNPSPVMLLPALQLKPAYTKSSSISARTGLSITSSQFHLI